MKLTHTAEDRGGQALTLDRLRELVQRLTEAGVPNDAVLRLTSAEDREGATWSVRAAWVEGTESRA